MTRIAFFEPDYVAENARDWEIRGSYKYPSLLGDLGDEADIRLLMANPPPEDDPHRQRLEADYGVRFHAIDSLEDARWPAAQTLVADYASAIAEHTPDIVSTLNGRMIGHNFAIARAAFEAGIDYVYRIAGNDIATQIAVQEKRGRPVKGTSLWATLAAQEAYAAEVARTIIVMSATERERVAPLVSDPSKIAICRRGVDRQHFAPAEEPAERCRNVLFVGRNSAEKGIDLIEQAAARLADSHPDIRFTIAGDFAEREEGNRRYLGFHDYAELPGLYRAHDALLLPARSEGFPQVVMEAMSCGLPVIVSRHLFSSDFTESGEGAALVDLDDEEIARIVAAWHDEPARYRALRAEALDHAAAHFDATRNSALYHTALLGEGNRTSPQQTEPFSGRRYWVVTDAALAASDAAIDPPMWGGAGPPVTAFIAHPDQRDAIGETAETARSVAPGESPVAALRDALKTETAPYIQLAFDAIEDFPPALALVAQRLTRGDADAVETAMLETGRHTTQPASGAGPAWWRTEKLRERLAAVDPALGPEDLATELGSGTGEETPQRLPVYAGTLFRGQEGEKIGTGEDSLALAAAAFAELDRQEVEFRLSYASLQAYAELRESKLQIRQERLEAEKAQLRDAARVGNKLRKRFARWRKRITGRR